MLTYNIIMLLLHLKFDGEKNRPQFQVLLRIFYALVVAYFCWFTLCVQA